MATPLSRLSSVRFVKTLTTGDRVLFPSLHSRGRHGVVERLSEVGNR
jgi:hypothetical protein